MWKSRTAAVAGYFAAIQYDNYVLESWQCKTISLEQFWISFITKFVHTAAQLFFINIWVFYHDGFWYTFISNSHGKKYKSNFEKSYGEQIVRSRFLKTQKLFRPG